MTTRSCINCGKETSPTATVCPDCGAEQPAAGSRWTRGRLKFAGALVCGILAILVLLFFMMVATDPGDNLVLVEAGVITGQSEHAFVVGALENRTDRSYNNVETSITLLDGDDNPVVSMFATTQTL